MVGSSKQNQKPFQLLCSENSKLLRRMAQITTINQSSDKIVDVIININFAWVPDKPDSTMANIAAHG